MKKLMLFVGLGLVAISANSADLDPSCEAYFKAVDEYVAGYSKTANRSHQAANGEYACGYTKNGLQTSNETAKTNA